MSIASGDTKKLGIAASVLTATLGVLAAVPAAAGPHDWAAGLPGCHPAQPAVAHHAGQQVISPQPTNGPVPCGMLTGWATVENRIAVTNDNAVIFMPALLPADPPQPVPGSLEVAAGCGNTPGVCTGNAHARSFDDGATWDSYHVVVHPESHLLQSDVDNRLYVDHETNRLFHYDYDSGTEGAPPSCGNGGGGTIMFSDDNGNTWRWGFSPDHNCSENPTILAANPRTSSPVGYPNVVYLCGNNFGTGVAGAGSTGKVCAKSVDGGLTWRGQLFPAPGGGQGCYSGQCKDLLNPYPQCALGASSSSNNDVQPLPNGTLVVPVTCGGNTYLAESRDEGASWKIRNRIPHGGSLRTDSAGNLYKLRESGASALLSTSTDGGLTWSPERDMIAPGVGSPRSIDYAIGTHRVGHQIGRVAINYYGIRTGETFSDGFITETRNALDPNPVFWSGQVNDRAAQGPLLYNNEPFSNRGITVLDFIGSAFSPDGRSVWGSFVKDCGTNILTDPNCTSRYPVTNPGTPQDGFASRLVWPQRRNFR